MKPVKKIRKKIPAPGPARKDQAPQFISDPANPPIMYGADIKMTDQDFEFARPPLSRNFILRTFEKYELEFIAHFGEEMYYISRQDSEPLIPVYADSRYPEEIELILDFMARERIQRIRYEKGELFRSRIPELPDTGLR